MRTDRSLSYYLNGHHIATELHCESDLRINIKTLKHNCLQKSCQKYNIRFTARLFVYHLSRTIRKATCLS